MTSLHQPFIPASSNLREFTWRAVILGMFLGIIFAVGNSYLGLKTGMTVSASIPAAVASMALLRAFAKNATILENNIAQTVASAGEGMAGGIIFTVPALFMLESAPSYSKIVLIGILGGILGIMMMIPFRHHLMVEEHPNLLYPEGTACAAILKVREGSVGKALLAVWGIVIGALDKLCMGVFKLWTETASWSIGTTKILLDGSPALLGVGYIIGIRYALYMFAGGALAWWVLIPLITTFGAGGGIVAPSSVAINEMSPDLIWASYIRYIGAGGVAIGGIFSLARIVPILLRSLKGHFSQMFHDLVKKPERLRTERDILFIWVVGSVVAVFILLYLLPQISLNPMALLLTLILGLFFVGLTSVTVGLIGVSSNPVSGMVICTLLVTCLTFLALGWQERLYLVMAMTVGCIIGVAIAIASDTSQDLKTGFLLGGTPRLQQLSMVVGIVLPALTMGWVLLLLNQAYGLGSNQLPAPQATLMALVVKGVMHESLPFYLVGIGALIAVIIELTGVRSLAIALGIYLPFSTTTSVACGGVLQWLLQKFSKGNSSREQGVLIGSGLVAGDAIIGVLIAFLTISGVISGEDHSLIGSWGTLIATLVIAILFGILTLKKVKS